MNANPQIYVAVVVFNEFRNDSRVEKISLSLAKQGMEVKVYATAGIGLPRTEKRPNYQVLRPYEAKSPVKRAGRIISSLGTFFLLLEGIRKIDLIHCNDLEPLLFCVWLKIITFGRIKIIYDAHELETEKNAAKGLRKHLSKFLEARLISKVDAFITVSPSIAEWYRKVYALENPTVVLNCPYYHEVNQTDLLRESLGIPQHKIIFLFQGGFSPKRGLPQLIKVFESADAPTDCVLVFLGFGSMHKAGMDLQKRIENASSKGTNIYFHPAVPYSELLNYTSSADIGLCLTEDTCLSHRYSLPNKLFEYAMAGIPMIVSDLPEMRKLVQTFDCGEICEILAGEGLLVSIRAILSRDLELLSENALRLARGYSWEKQELKLIELYQSLLPLN